MKEIIVFLVIVVILFRLLPEPDPKREASFTGYIVAKEYTPAHRSNEVPKTVSYAVTPIVPRIVTAPPPNFVANRWTWYVANKYEVKKFNVDSVMFFSCGCGDKVRITL